MVVDAADGKGEPWGKICENVEASYKSDMWKHLISLGQEVRKEKLLYFVLSCLPVILPVISVFRSKTPW